MNLLAAVTYAFTGPVAWNYAAMLTAASVLGGFIGARWGKSIPATPCACRSRSAACWSPPCSASRRSADAT
jgi:hypothetical protein